MIALPVVLQSNDFTCGAACVEAVRDYFGVPENARVPVPTTPIDGASPDVLENVLWQSGLSVTSGSMDLDDLRHHTKKGRPVVCVATEDDGCGHWVCVAGFTRRKHEGKTVPCVLYLDPLEGMMTEPALAFEARWFDSTRRGVKYIRWGLAVDGG